MIINNSKNFEKEQKGSLRVKEIENSTSQQRVKGEVPRHIGLVINSMAHNQNVADHGVQNVPFWKAT